VHEAQQSVHLIAASAGFVSYFLLWLSAVWGVVLKNGWGFTRVRHATIYGIHQTLTLFGLTLGVVHALAQLAAPGTHVRVVDEILPFANPQDPVGIGLGVIALELMLALAVSVLVQRWLGYHRWRRLHVLAYVSYTLLTGHLLISGSETGAFLVRLPIVLSLVVLIGLASASTIAARMSSRGATARTAGVSDVVVNVDPSRCVRYGFCVHEAPELFRLQSDGRLNYRAAVPPELVERALRAAQACPARAIMLGRRPTAVVMATEAPEQELRGARSRETRGGPAPPATEHAGRGLLRPVSGNRVESER
jgi:sulfoxide reductase heme-binding subunit YedZ